MGAVLCVLGILACTAAIALRDARSVWPMVVAAAGFLVVLGTPVFEFCRVMHESAAASPELDDASGDSDDASGGSDSGSDSDSDSDSD